MSIIYNKIKDGNICVEFLETEINDSVIVPILELIIVNDNRYIQLTFSVALSPTDELLLNSIIETHSCLADDTELDFDNFATVQLNNLNTIILNPTTYSQILLPNVLIETNQSVVEKNHDTNGILINESGLYNISYNGIIESDVVTCSCKLIIMRNGIEIDVDGSEQVLDFSQALPWTLFNYGKQYHITNIDINIHALLLKDDVIYIKAFKSVYTYANNRYLSYFPQTDDDTYAIIKKNSILSVTKMTGPTGPKGENGKSIKTELIIKKQNAIKASNVEKINFIGNVTVTDDGNDQVSVAILSNQNDMLIHQIMGADNALSEPMAFIQDSTRGDKLLSIESSALQFGESKLRDNDWFMINDASHTDAGFSMPYDGTITKASGSCSSSEGTSIDVFINDNGTQILVFDDDDDQQNDYCTNINLSFNKDDLIRLKARTNDDDDDETKNAVVIVWVKWEMRT